MMKKILLSLSIALMACVTSFSQEVISVDLPAAFVPGEEATVTVTYSSDQAGFFRALFSQSTDEAGTSFDFGSPLTAANSFGSVGEIAVTGLGTQTVDLTFIVPLSAPVSADVAPLKAMMQIDMNNAPGSEFGTPFRGVINVEASATSGSISAITLPTTGASGGVVSIPITYTHNFPTAQAIDCYIIQADADGNLDFNGTGTEAYATIQLAAPGTDVSGTYEFSIPATIPATADLPDGRTWFINVKAFDKDTRGPITITAAANSGSITSVTATPEVGGVPTQEIGQDLSVTFGYEHDYADGLEVEVALVVAEIGGDFVDFPGTGWKTAGFTKLASTIPNDGTSESFNLSLAPAEVDVTSADLAANNQEWRIYIRLNDPNTLVNGVPAVVAESRETVVDVVLNDVVDLVSVVSSSYTTIAPGDSTLVTFEYSSTEDAVVEVSIQEYIDQFTALDPANIVSEVKFVVDLAATTEPGEKVTVEQRVKVLEGTTPSSDLTGTNNYRIVAKLLHGDAETNTFINQTTFPVLIGNPKVNVFGKVNTASFTLFPNPANGVVNFSKAVSNVVVYDATGNVVITEANATSLNTASLEAGIYMVNTDQGSTKLIVE